MGINSKKTPLFSDNWSPGFGSMFSIFNKPDRRAFSKLKEIYGSELIKAHQKKLTSKPLSKEEKNKIKDKIANDLKSQQIKNILILIFSVLMSLLILFVISYSLKNYFEI